MSVLSDIDNECTRCGICSKQQALEGMPLFMCGDLAQQLAAADDIYQVSPEAYEFILSCSLCDACTADCPEEISCAKLVKVGRARLLALQPELEEPYRAFRVDYRENLFTALRKAAGFSYEDALEISNTPLQGTPPSSHGVDSVSLFFPGCSLASYSETLTNATYELLKSRGVVQGMSVYCCGKPLNDHGASKAYDDYGKGLIARLRQQHVSRLVIACPNCFASVKTLFEDRGVEDIALKILPDVLNELGITYADSEFASLAVHDSCPDRFCLHFAQATRALLKPSGASLFEMENNSRNTICCGAGGLAQVNGQAQGDKRCARRLEQFESTGAECLVCSCAGCANAFVSVTEASEVRHYLELLLSIRINWREIQLAIDKMYSESQEVFTLPLEESTRIFDV